MNHLIFNYRSENCATMIPFCVHHSLQTLHKCIFNYIIHVSLTHNSNINKRLQAPSSSMPSNFTNSTKSLYKVRKNPSPTSSKS